MEVHSFMIDLQDDWNRVNLMNVFISSVMLSELA